MYFTDHDKISQIEKTWDLNVCPFYKLLGCGDRSHRDQDYRTLLHLFFKIFLDVCLGSIYHIDTIVNWKE